MVAALWGRLFRPIRENPHRTAPSNAQKQYTEFEAGELQKVLPRSDVSMHLLGVDNEKCADHQRGDKPRTNLSRLKVLGLPFQAAYPMAAAIVGVPTKRVSNRSPSTIRRAVCDPIVTQRNRTCLAVCLALVGRGGGL